MKKAQAMFNKSSEVEDTCRESTGRLEGGDATWRGRKTERARAEESNTCFGGHLNTCMGEVLLGFIWPIVLLHLALSGLRNSPVCTHTF